MGAALLVGTFFGRSRGLIAVGVVLAFFAGTFAVLDVPLRGDIGRDDRATGRDRLPSRAAIRSRSAISSSTCVTPSSTESPAASRLTDAMGFIEVFVPADARVEVKARSDVGSLDILERPELSGSDKHTVVIDDPPGASGPRIVIDAHVGFGAVKVVRSDDARDVAAAVALEVSR